MHKQVSWHAKPLPACEDLRVAKYTIWISLWGSAALFSTRWSITQHLSDMQFIMYAWQVLLLPPRVPRFLICKWVRCVWILKFSNTCFRIPRQILQNRASAAADVLNDLWSSMYGFRAVRSCRQIVVLLFLTHVGGSTEILNNYQDQYRSMISHWSVRLARTKWIVKIYARKSTPN